MRFLVAILALLFCACSQRVPPTKTLTSIAQAKTSARVIKERVATVSKKVEEAKVISTDVREGAKAVRDFVYDGGLSKEAKEKADKVVENAIILEAKLQEAQGEAKKSKEEAEFNELNASRIETDFKEFAESAAKDAAIADEVNSHWGFGAIWYGIKKLSWRLAIVAVVVGAAGWAIVNFVPGLKISAWLLSKFASLFTRKSNTS